MEMASMHKIYCSLCGKNIKECTCKKTNPVETKVTQPKETKQDVKLDTKPSK